MRFNSPAEVLAEAAKAAPGRVQRHKEHGHDLNPYSTPGRRSDWQRGYDGDLPRSYELSFDYNIVYQLGAATRKIIDSQPKD